MNNRGDVANQFFFNGFNCAQSVLHAFQDELGNDENMVLRLAAGMGGGIAGTGQICGAVNGAIMVLGARFGHDLEQNGNKELLNLQIHRFLNAFKLAHGSTTCKQLLHGADLTTPEGAQKMKEHLKTDVCAKCVRTSVQILETMKSKDVE